MQRMFGALGSRFKSKDLSRRLRHALAEEADIHQLIEYIDQFLIERARLSIRLCYVQGHRLYGPAASVELTKEQLQQCIAYGQQSAKAVVCAPVADQTVQYVMELCRATALVPLAYQQEFVGMVWIERQRSGLYTGGELRLLQAIASDIAVVVTHVLAVEEMRQLNASLRQNIETTTRELRTSNRQLQHLDHVKNEFISMASHQLRTPLTSIKGYLDMVLQGDLGEITDSQRDALKEAFASSERMARLINDFLNVSRLQTGRFVIDRQLTNMAQLVQQEVELLEVVAKQRQVKLVVEIDSRVPLMWIDIEKIRQGVMNMIDNAIYYSPPGSSVLVRLELADGQVVLTVTDSGIGVPANEQAEVFQKFFRGSNARKRRPDGTGIGLFLVRKVVLAHGGQMIFHSVEGQGSTFGFRLPLTHAGSQLAQQTQDARQGKHQKQQHQ